MTSPPQRCFHACAPRRTWGPTTTAGVRETHAAAARCCVWVASGGQTVHLRRLSPHFGCAASGSGFDCTRVRTQKYKGMHLFSLWWRKALLVGESYYSVNKLAQVTGSGYSFGFTQHCQSSSTGYSAHCRMLDCLRGKMRYLSHDTGVLAVPSRLGPGEQLQAPGPRRLRRRGDTLGVAGPVIQCAADCLSLDCTRADGNRHESAHRSRRQVTSKETEAVNCVGGGSRGVGSGFAPTPTPCFPNKGQILMLFHTRLQRQTTLHNTVMFSVYPLPPQRCGLSSPNPGSTRVMGD